MSHRMLVGLALACAALGFAVSLPANSAAQEKSDKPIQIGMVKTFFNDVPDDLKILVTQPFNGVMKATTGLEGKLVANDGTFDVADQLDANKLHLGVFHGHEFAWAQKKYPNLKPLVVVVNDHNDVNAFVVVHKDNPAQSLKDLRGKTLDLPKMTREHCRIYVDKHFTDNANPDPKSFFSAIKKSESAYDGMDDVAGRKVNAVVVDTIALEFYKNIKPAVFNKNLRVLHRSQPTFPSPVIAYKEGSLDTAKLKKLRDGLMAAHTNDDCKVLLELWQIKGFEAVPAKYTESLHAILKEYPTPEPSKVSMP